MLLKGSGSKSLFLETKEMFENGVKLKDIGSFKIGGEAKYFVDVKTIEEAKTAVTDWHKLVREKGLSPEKVFVLGGGTNILWKDEGFDGLVLHQNLKDIKVLGNEVTVGGGVSVSELLEFLTAKSLSGLEWAGGLPGTVGGAICDNAGAFGGEIKDSIIEVLSLDMESGELVKRGRADCGFAYRRSLFKTLPAKEIILEAKFGLAPRDGEVMHEKILEKIYYRESRHPLEYPNIGSIFKNVDVEKYPQLKQPPHESHIKVDPFPVVPAAYLISEAGLKGTTCGGAMVSTKHSNFIVNIKEASAKDVSSLIDLVKSAVQEKFGVKLEEEVIIYP